jgi:hypothetical protein
MHCGLSCKRVIKTVKIVHVCVHCITRFLLQPVPTHLLSPPISEEVLNPLLRADEELLRS